MKKLLLGSLTVVMLYLGFVANIASAANTVTFEGIVTNNGQPVPNASVLVSCEDGFTSRYADHNGKYAIKLITICPFGKVATIVAGPRHGSGHGSVQVIVNKVNMAVNVALGNEFTVPEFGWLGGVLAIGGGIAAIVFARPRRLQTEVH